MKHSCAGKLAEIIPGAVNAAQVGFHFEEGGCWGFAIALGDLLCSRGTEPTYCASVDGFVHAWVRADGIDLDHAGRIHNPCKDAQVMTREQLIALAMTMGVSACDLEADRALASEILMEASAAPSLSPEGSATAYHVTPAECLPDIMADGLRPSIGPRSRALGETAEAVYLFPTLTDAEDALMGWLGDEIEEDVVIIEVECGERPLPGSFEIAVTEHIRPERIIRVLDEMRNEIDPNTHCKPGC